jgi:hypothetical protein
MRPVPLRGLVVQEGVSYRSKSMISLELPFSPDALIFSATKSISIRNGDEVMRLVITKRNRDTILLDASGRVNQGIPDDSYRERLIKYIPAETIALFVAVYGMTYYLSGSEDWYPLMARWILIAGILGTGVYLWQAEGVTDLVQLAISTIGFVIWTCALGVVTVAALPFYNAIVAAALLVVWVFGAPLVDGWPAKW